MKRIFLCLPVLLFSINSYAFPLRHAVDQLISKMDPAINIGIDVVDLTTAETLYQRNASRTFIPASNMKLFSNAAALIALGPDYHFPTRLSTDASVLDNGRLNGSVYLHLSGDPSFTRQHLQQLLSELKTWGVKRIDGNFVIVSNHRTIDAYPPGWMDEDFRYSYGAPLAPVILDENRITVTVNPAHKAGLPALVELSNPQAAIPIDNQVKTRPTAKNCGIDFNITQDNALMVKGCVGTGQPAVQQGLAIRSPLRYVQTQIKQQLAFLDIALTGKIILGTTKKNGVLLANHHSKPITQLVRTSLKFSDNLYADSLFLQAAEKVNQAPANWPEAGNVIKRFLQKQTGVNFDSAIFIDGSGLSRHNRVTPHQTLELLRFLQARFPFAYEYIAALPSAGLDGTLKRRFKKQGQQGKIRAKTGTMTGVVSLSGYLKTRNAHTLAFAMFVNGSGGGHRLVIDALCDFLLKQTPRLAQNTQTGAKTPSTSSSQTSAKHPSTSAKPDAPTTLSWRTLEAAMKQAFKEQSVTVLFRGNGLFLQDNSPDSNQVWAILEKLGQKYPFSATLHSASAPKIPGTQAPHLLWIKEPPASSKNQRTWFIHEAVR